MARVWHPGCHGLRRMAPAGCSKPSSTTTEAAPADERLTIMVSTVSRISDQTFRDHNSDTYATLLKSSRLQFSTVLAARARASPAAAEQAPDRDDLRERHVLRTRGGLHIF